MSDIIETLRRLQCSDAACGDLRIAMGAKLAIYEIERLTAERDEARREICVNATAEPYRQLCGSGILLPQDEARERGWDCFKEDDK